MQFRIEDRGGGGPVRLVGELDMANADLALRRLRPLAGEGRDLELDLGDLSFLDSSGLHVMVQLVRELEGRGRLVLLRPRPFVRRLLALTGLDRHNGIAILGDDGDVSDPRDAYRHGYTAPRESRDP